jgi:siroheme synthase
VFGRGGEEALALAAAGIPFRIVPGVTAGLGALAYAGIPATHRGVARSVAFVTGHTTGGAPPVDWGSLAAGAETLVLYMALHRLPAIALALLEAGRDPAEPLSIIADGTTPWQQATRTTLANVAEALTTVDHGRPTLIVIGPVVGFADLLTPWLRNQPASVPTGSSHHLATQR